MQFYSRQNANVHRLSHTPGIEAEALFEIARRRVARFIGASHPREIVFTSGTTMAINGIALSLCRQFHQGDRILVSAVEHHSNLVPWQMLADRFGL
jgi:selenocysteine lyase/cysteine desulfurase